MPIVCRFMETPPCPPLYLSTAADHSISWHRQVAQKGPNGLPVVSRGRGCIAFPVHNGERMDAEDLGYLSLEEFPVNTALPKVVAQCFQLVRIGLRPELCHPNRIVAKRQRWDNTRPHRAT